MITFLLQKKITYHIGIILFSLAEMKLKEVHNIRQYSTAIIISKVDVHLPKKVQNSRIILVI